MRHLHLHILLALSLCLPTALLGQPPQEAPQPANHLAGETSPYLLQHAHNPVDWYPWGAEALAKAKKENKLIFLSIGYSSCHWCHVMERESFTDKEIAALMNKHFVCIKVDREERPDIDTIYMTSLHVFHQLNGVNRGGGWPLSMFLTPQAEPFFGGTYFPARDGDRGPTVGFLTVLKRVQEVWGEAPEKIERDAELLTRFVKRELETARSAADFQPSTQWLSDVQEALADQFDPTYGGFSYRAQQPNLPKFPEPANLVFLIRQIQRSRAAGADQDDAKPNGQPTDRDKAKPADGEDGAEDERPHEQALRMLTVTLDNMARGGIRDHLGGGFHRYSVDRYWRIPHFEKMLYDNGQLATVYAEAYQLTGRPQYRRVVQELAEFVLRELTSPEGGFYAALDAESEGEEGKFYRWQKEELQEVLSDEEYSLAAAAYGLDEPPNFEGEYYALQLAGDPAELAQAAQLSEQQWQARLRPIRDKLLARRERRERPLTDTKVLTSWNGLMIRGLADAGRLLEEPRYTQAAARAANFVLDNLREDDGRLRRSYGQGEAKLNAYLDDYAFLAHGLLGLHQATGEAKWLEAAREVTDQQIERFWDDTSGGFFFTSDDHESLLARARSQTDGALPAGNSVAAGNLLRLAELLQQEGYRQKGRRTIASVAALLKASPAASPQMAVAVQQLQLLEKE